MRRSIVVFAGLVLLILSSPASGQMVDATAPDRLEHVGASLKALPPDPFVPKDTPIEKLGWFVAPFVQYGAPQRLTGGMSAFLPIGKRGLTEGSLGIQGMELQGSAGQGGWRVAGGAFAAAVPWWWADVLLTTTRTVDDPRGTVAESSHVGAEVGFAILTPVNDFISHRFAVMLKPSFGFGYRLDGPTDTKRTMYTWSVGVHVPTEFLSFR